MLSDRDYSNRTQQERAQRSVSNKSQSSRNDVLWQLYGKEHKSFIDKIRIKLIERKNIKDADRR